MSLMQHTALELGRMIRSGEIRAVSAVRAALDAVEKKDPELNSFITVDGERALSQAEQAEKKIRSGELTGPLSGVPMAVKDNLCTEGLETTCGSAMLRGYVPAYSATAVRLLMEAGAVLIGKTNMDEFGMGNTSGTSACGAVRNPRNTCHVPGGSSGGSCAAVAAGLVPYALGTDTGGSIRQPCSFCGVAGIKPTYGTVSRYGLIAYGSSLEQIGPIAGNISDCAAVLETIAAHDPLDSTSVRRRDTHFTEALFDDVRGMKIGIPKDWLGEGLDREVRAAVLDAGARLTERGAVVREFDLGLLDYAAAAYYVIACAEAGSNLSRFDGVRYGMRAKDYRGIDDMYRRSRTEGFGAEVKRRIMLGSFVLSAGYYDAYYRKAQQVRRLIKNSFDEAFARYDVILGPVAPTVAPKMTEQTDDRVQKYLGDIYTVSANLAGIPGISLPVGVHSSGLPIGVQLLGNCFEERTLIRAAYSLEQACGRRGNG